MGNLGSTGPEPPARAVPMSSPTAQEEVTAEGWPRTVASKVRPEDLTGGTKHQPQDKTNTPRLSLFLQGVAGAGRSGSGLWGNLVLIEMVWAPARIILSRFETGTESLIREGAQPQPVSLPTLVPFVPQKPKCAQPPPLTALMSGSQHSPGHAEHGPGPARSHGSAGKLPTST